MIAAKTLPISAQDTFDDAVKHHLAGRIDEAIAQYERSILLEPNHAEACNNMGAALAAKGRLEEAMARYIRALSLKPDYAEAWNNLGVALLTQGKLAEAVACHEYAVVVSPADARMYCTLGAALAAQGRIDAAAARYRQALSLKPDYADAHNNLGNLLIEQNRPGEAAAHFAQAIAANPGNAEAHTNLGNSLRDQGRFDEALAHYDRAIRIRPALVEAHYNRAEIKTFRAGDADLTALEGLARGNDLPSGKGPFIHFALAKALDDVGDYERAFAHLRQGNGLKRRQIRYDESGVADSFKRIATVFDKELFDRLRGEGDPSPAPVFVLGMPRSGSTLVEQILAGHPSVFAAGEVMDLERALGTANFPECIRSIDGPGLRQIAQAYLSRLPPLSQGQVRVVNKLPRNLLYIGLIRLILPNARIIHTVRDPVDTCMSCYSKLFTSGQHFSYDLAELGRFYRRYAALMDHWRSVLDPNSVLEVVHEDVVNDLEGQARRLIDYCGLAWDNRCLNFQSASRFIQTASAVQVRKPLSRRSLQRWRKYEFGLGPLLRELGDIVPGRTMAARGSR